MSLIEPVPDDEQVVPGPPEQVHVAPVSVAGSASLTREPKASDGPALLTITVYVSGDPATADVVPSVLVIDKSVDATTVSVSVAVLSVGLVSVGSDGPLIVAVLAIEPVAEGRTVAVKVYVADDPAAKSMVSLIEPEPPDEQLAPADGEHVHDAPVNPAGSVSTTVAPVTLEGPAFDAVMV